MDIEVIISSVLAIFVEFLLWEPMGAVWYSLFSSFIQIGEMLTVPWWYNLLIIGLLYFLVFFAGIYTVIQVVKQLLSGF
ncbi:MAG: hypothetical protein QME68_06795 [Elusimicrobiota bacterium]|nr:hypothetical protein [Elusimicrobiota bacterium]